LTSRTGDFDLRLGVLRLLATIVGLDEAGGEESD
jgi:hypothetical protein